MIANSTQKSGLKYYVPKVNTKAFTIPVGKTVPFDWKVAELKPISEGVSLKWETKIKAKNKLTLFRLTSATDVREECTLELSSGKSNEVIGTLDVKYAHYMQPFQLEISFKQLKKIEKEGLVVKMKKGTKPFWFFVPNENSDIPTVFLPHLLVYDKKQNGLTWKDRLTSLGSISTFGWMEGIVLDGLNSVGDRAMIQKHFDKYLVNDELVYESYNNIRIKDSLTTVESILPFAFMAMRNEKHPMLKTAIDFCSNHADTTSVIIDAFGGDRFLKTEECYTVSFPLAVLAKKLKRPDLEHMAIVNLQTRVKMLSDANFIYQKSTEKGEKKLANWARGIGWYLLGLAKTLAVLPVSNETLELRKSFLLGAEIALRHQQSNGLWSCFIHEQETGIETSGSAVIGAAFAYGYSQNLLPEKYKIAAQKCQKGLLTYLTPDGFLTGSAQVNKGGESLQRNGFRVISPYTLGFLGIIEEGLK